MMTPMSDMMPMAPQIMGCCFFDVFRLMSWMISVATPLIAIGAIVYLLTKRPEAEVNQEFSR